MLDAFEGERSGGRPLYLKLAFEEARLWPSHVPAEELEPGIDGVIQKNLFHRLAREENHGEELVARTVGYLAASRYGLAEDELLDVLSRDADLYESFLHGSYHLPSDLVARAIEYRRSRGVEGGEGEKRRGASVRSRGCARSSRTPTARPSCGASSTRSCPDGTARGCRWCCGRASSSISRRT